MLEHEWRELETLCEKISDLRHRQSYAMRSKNVGLMEGLKQDVQRARRQREQLVRHISARLGSVTAEMTESTHGTLAQLTGERSDTTVDIVGF